MKKDPANDARRKILPEHEPFVFLCVASGKTYKKTAEELKEKYGVVITEAGVYDYVQHRHRDRYDKFLTKIRNIWLANAFERVVVLHTTVKLLHEKIEHVLTKIPPRQWLAANIAALLREEREYLLRIQEECGDKPKSGKEEGDRGGQVIQIFNTIPGMYGDGDGDNAGKESSTAGSGFRMDRL